MDLVRSHLVYLRSLDVGHEAIAEQANVSTRTIVRILQREVHNVKGPVAAALLAVEPSPDLQSPRVGVVGAARRLRSLCAMGWSLTELASRCGVPRQTLGSWCEERCHSIPRISADAVAELYDELYAVDGPCNLTRDRAERRGWDRQIWLDEHIDDPDAAPLDASTFIDEVAVRRVLGGERSLVATLTRQETAEVVRLGTKAGASQSDLADLLGTNSRQVCRIRARLRDAGLLTEAVADTAVAAVAAMAADVPVEAPQQTPGSSAPRLACQVRRISRPTLRQAIRRPHGRRGLRTASQRSARVGDRRNAPAGRRASVPRRGGSTRSAAGPGPGRDVSGEGSVMTPASRPKGLTPTSMEWCIDPVTGRRGFSWNFVDGCEHASPGCDFCYAEGIDRLALLQLSDEEQRAVDERVLPLGAALSRVKQLRDERDGRPVRTAPPAKTGPRREQHFTGGHPLAADAWQRCQESRGAHQDWFLLGGVACGSCWEAAIRDDQSGKVAER